MDDKLLILTLFTTHRVENFISLEENGFHKNFPTYLDTYELNWTFFNFYQFLFQL